MLGDVLLRTVVTEWVPAACAGSCFRLGSQTTIEAHLDVRLLELVEDAEHLADECASRVAHVCGVERVSLALEGRVQSEA